MQKWLSHIHHHARCTCESDIKHHTLPLSLKKGEVKVGEMLKDCLNLLLWKKKNYLDCGPKKKAEPEFLKECSLPNGS